VAILFEMLMLGIVSEQRCEEMLVKFIFFGKEQSQMTLMFQYQEKLNSGAFIRSIFLELEEPCCISKMFFMKCATHKEV
jgi:hypothetical protein